MVSQATNQEQIEFSRHADLTRAFQILALGLGDKVSLLMQNYLDSEQWLREASAKLGRAPEHDTTDPYFQLLVIKRFWGPVFSKLYEEDLRPIIDELIEIRNLWAHFSLPNDVATLDRAVIIMERLLAPVDADAAVNVRSVRFRLKHPRDKDVSAPSEYERQRLQTELDESQRLFENIQEQNTALSDELAESRKISAKKQLKLSSLENQISAIQSKSDALEFYISQQRQRHDRIEWLFAVFLAVVMVAIALSLR